MLSQRSRDSLIEEYYRVISGAPLFKGSGTCLALPPPPGFPGFLLAPEWISNPVVLPCGPVAFLFTKVGPRTCVDVCRDV